MRSADISNAMSMRRDMNSRLGRGQNCMDESVPPHDQMSSFIERWKASGGSEHANYPS
jgi:hypothetical protein